MFFVSRYFLLRFPFFNKLLGTARVFLIHPIRDTTSSANFTPSGFFLESLLETRTSPSLARLRERVCLKSSSRRVREVSKDREVRAPKVSLTGPSTAILSELKSSILADKTGADKHKMEDRQLVGRQTASRHWSDLQKDQS